MRCQDGLLAVPVALGYCAILQGECLPDFVNSGFGIPCGGPDICTLRPLKELVPALLLCLPYGPPKLLLASWIQLIPAGLRLRLAFPNSFLRSCSSGFHHILDRLHHRFLRAC